MNLLDDDLAHRVKELISQYSGFAYTIALAESLTGGLVHSVLTNPSGASNVMKGGIVAYNVESKAQLLNVDRQLLGERGAVNAEVAIQMARGARSRFDATFGVSTTGEAGIYSQSGAEVGKVFIAVSSLGSEFAEEFQFDGSRDEIRWSTMLAVLQTLDGLLPIVDPDFGAMGMSGEGRPPRS